MTPRSLPLPQKSSQEHPTQGQPRITARATHELFESQDRGEPHSDAEATDFAVMQDGPIPGRDHYAPAHGSRAAQNEIKITTNEIAASNLPGRGTSWQAFFESKEPIRLEDSRSSVNQPRVFKSQQVPHPDAVLVACAEPSSAEGTVPTRVLGNSDLDYKSNKGQLLGTGSDLHPLSSAQPSSQTQEAIAVASLAHSSLYYQQRNSHKRDSMMVFDTEVCQQVRNFSIEDDMHYEKEEFVEPIRAELESSQAAAISFQDEQEIAVQQTSMFDEVVQSKVPEGGQVDVAVPSESAEDPCSPDQISDIVGGQGEPQAEALSGGCGAQGVGQDVQEAVGEGEGLPVYLDSITRNEDAAPCEKHLGKKRRSKNKSKTYMSRSPPQSFGQKLASEFKQRPQVEGKVYIKEGQVRYKRRTGDSLQKFQFPIRKAHYDEDAVKKMVIKQNSIQKSVKIMAKMKERIMRISDDRAASPDAMGFTATGSQDYLKTDNSQEIDVSMQVQGSTCGLPSFRSQYAMTPIAGEQATFSKLFQLASAQVPSEEEIYNLAQNRDDIERAQMLPKQSNSQSVLPLYEVISEHQQNLGACGGQTIPQLSDQQFKQKAASRQDKHDQTCEDYSLQGFQGLSDGEPWLLAGGDPPHDEFIQIKDDQSIPQTLQRKQERLIATSALGTPATNSEHKFTRKKGRLIIVENRGVSGRPLQDPVSAFNQFYQNRQTAALSIRASNPYPQDNLQKLLLTPGRSKHSPFNANPSDQESYRNLFRKVPVVEREPVKQARTNSIKKIYKSKNLLEAITVYHNNLLQTGNGHQTRFRRSQQGSRHVNITENSPPQFYENKSPSPLYDAPAAERLGNGTIGSTSHEDIVRMQLESETHSQVASPFPPPKSKASQLLDNHLNPIIERPKNTLPAKQSNLSLPRHGSTCHRRLYVPSRAGLGPPRSGQLSSTKSQMKRQILQKRDAHQKFQKWVMHKGSKKPATLFSSQRPSLEVLHAQQLQQQNLIHTTRSSETRTFRSKGAEMSMNDKVATLKQADLTTETLDELVCPSAHGSTPIVLTPNILESTIDEHPKINMSLALKILNDPACGNTLEERRAFLKGYAARASQLDQHGQLPQNLKIMPAGPYSAAGEDEKRAQTGHHKLRSSLDEQQQLILVQNNNDSHHLNQMEAPSCSSLPQIPDLAQQKFMSKTDQDSMRIRQLQAAVLNSLPKAAALDGKNATHSTGFLKVPRGEQRRNFLKNNYCAIGSIPYERMKAHKNMKLKRDWKGRMPTRSPELQGLKAASTHTAKQTTSPRLSKRVGKASKMTFRMPESRHSNRKQPPGSNQAYQRTATGYRKRQGQPTAAEDQDLSSQFEHPQISLSMPQGSSYMETVQVESGQERSSGLEQVSRLAGTQQEPQLTFEGTARSPQDAIDHLQEHAVIESEHSMNQEVPQVLAEEDAHPDSVRQVDQIVGEQIITEGHAGDAALRYELRSESQLENASFNVMHETPLSAGLQQQPQQIVIQEPYGDSKANFLPDGEENDDSYSEDVQASGQAEDGEDSNGALQAYEYLPDSSDGQVALSSPDTHADEFIARVGQEVLREEIGMQSSPQATAAFGSGFANTYFGQEDLGQDGPCLNEVITSSDRHVFKDGNANVAEANAEDDEYSSHYELASSRVDQSQQVTSPMSLKDAASLVEKPPNSQDQDVDDDEDYENDFEF